MRIPEWRASLATVIGLVCALMAVAATPDRQLKVYVSVDMEGISGVVDTDQTTAEGHDYASARRWMTEDVNAVVAGLLAAGATEVVVNDSHGSMRNILPDLLHPRAVLISGSPKPLSMMEGLDGSFAACVFVGYHSKAGSVAGILDHTISSRSVHHVAVNGIEMPELGLNAAIAGSFDVPVVMLSGDAQACSQAHALLGEGLVTVAVKEGLGRNAARLLPMAVARRRLEDAAREALLGREARAPYRLDPPYRFEVEFLSSAKAELGELLPMTVRVDGRTLAFRSDDYLEGFGILRALIALAGTR